MRVRAVARTALARTALARVAVALGALGVACASPGVPPGGPPDKEPPALLGVTPETSSVNVKARSVVFRFDEVINERSSPIGAATPAGGAGSFGGNSASTLHQLVVVSPSDGRERVTWRRTGIEIEPRGGFRANTTYRVTLLPGLADLRGNLLREPVEVVFSTGPTRESRTIAGAIFDWTAGKVAPLATIEAFTGADTTLRWSTRADSSGRFVLRDLPEGDFLLRGYVDTDGDRRIDPREIHDQAPVALVDSARIDLYAFVHDTIGPRIEGLDPVDSTAVRVRFDRAADLNWRPDAGTVVLLRSDSTEVPLGAMVPSSVFDSTARAAAALRAAADSAAADSAARADPTRRPDPAAAPAPAVPLEVLAPARAAATDTVPKPKLERPIPVSSWVVPFAAPLPPGEYLLKVRGIRSLTGAVRDSERQFRLRPPPAPRDTSAAARTRPAAGARPPAS